MYHESVVKFDLAHISHHLSRDDRVNETRLIELGAVKDDACKRGIESLTSQRHFHHGYATTMSFLISSQCVDAVTSDLQQHI